MKKYPHLEVRGSKIHRRGVFAARDIKKGEEIIEYTGRRLNLAQSDRSRSDYLFMINSKLSIDGKNTARYINHSCEPNCEAGIEKGRIWIDAIRDIKKGEELTYNYGYDLKEYKDYPCACRRRRCVGYILHQEHWPALKKLRRKKRGVLKSASKAKRVFSRVGKA